MLEGGRSMLADSTVALYELNQAARQYSGTYFVAHPASLGNKKEIATPLKHSLQSTRVRDATDDYVLFKAKKSQILFLKIVKRK
jgi:hypothetical protein